MGNQYFGDRIRIEIKNMYGKIIFQMSGLSNEKNENCIFFLFIMYCCIYTQCCTRSKA